MLYIGRVSYDQDRESQESSVGSFEVLVEADNPEAAADAFRHYLASIPRKDTGGGFDGKTEIYLDDIFQIKLPLEAPALINYVSQRSEGFSMISKAVIDAPPAIESYEWGDPDSDAPSYL
jgi:hypothetical protein